MKNTIIRNAIFFCFAFGFFFIENSAQAQSEKKAQKSEAAQLKSAQEEEFKPAAAGTYQILAKDAQSHEVFPIDILLEIERKRHKTDIVYLKAGESSIIKILPYRTIRSKNFEPLPEYGIQK